MAIESIDIDVDMVKDILVGIALADHMGDVNGELRHLAPELGLGTGEWSDKWCRVIFSWENKYE